MGYTVFQGDIPFADDTFEVTADIKYWFALHMECEGQALFCNNISLIGEQHWWCLHGVWGSCQDYFGETREGCYAIYGDSTGIESASLGQIKASCK
ncbi:MAG: hypothetical protein GY771_16045 [bacterium]|nr:hypothetical protein [bacterium]